MTGKVIRPKPKLVSKHLNPPAKVEPVNAKQVKAHYVGKHSFTLLQWLPGVMLTVLALSAVWAGVAVFQKANYASVGEMACKQGALREPVNHCADTDLDCLTSLNSQELDMAKDAIRERNVSMAKACIGAM